jgi:L-alanine-DL-glutamate epimerase-like enolase superfamily enzyme
MKITNVSTLALSAKYEEPIVDALYPVNERQSLLIFIESDEKITGIGEAACYGGPIISTKTVIEKELKPQIIGEDPFRIERIWKKLFWSSYEHARRGLVLTAIGGIDIALWDIIGKVCKQPVYKLCGAYRDKILGYASGGYYKRKRVKGIGMKSRDIFRVDLGAVKIKIGRNNNIPLRPNRPNRMRYR